jgi:hypothetical protein
MGYEFTLYHSYIQPMAVQREAEICSEEARDFFQSKIF